MKRRSNRLTQDVAYQEDDDDDSLPAKREKNNNAVTNDSPMSTGFARDNAGSDPTVDGDSGSRGNRGPSGDRRFKVDRGSSQTDDPGSDPRSDPNEDSDSTMGKSVEVRPTKKGPKRLTVKSKNKMTDDKENEDDCLTVVRCKMARQFKLLVRDNFNFANRMKKRTDLVHHFSRLELHGPSDLFNSVMLKPLLNSIRGMSVQHNIPAFDRRITAIEWHPIFSNKVAIGSKGGELSIFDINNMADPVMFPGIGAGGSIGAMRFCTDDPEWLLTSCLNSTVELKNLRNANMTKVLYDTGDWNKWFVSCDLNRSLYAAGQSTGILQIFDRRSLDILVEQKIHKGKITHVEFSKHHEYLLSTASVDHQVMIWDIRKDMTSSKKPTPLHVLPHDAGVNICSFSASNGQRLLTSDQYGQIRVYAMPGFYLERSILHPHRQFQHLTPIKASWHPLQDLIVIGRWPDPDFVNFSPSEKRTIDIFDANTGQLSLQLFDGSLGGIISLNKFSNDGQFLCSGMSRNCLIWRQPKDCTEEWMEAILGRANDPLAGDLNGLGQVNGPKGGKKPRGKAADKQTKDKQTKSKQTKEKQTKTKQTKSTKVELKVTTKTKSRKKMDEDDD